MNKTILITGASSGIGLATTRRLLTQGYQLISIARDFSKTGLEHKNLIKIEMDLSDLIALPDQLKKLVKTSDTIDAAVLCAGRGEFASLEEFSHQNICALMDLNFTSQVYITKALVPLMKQKKQGDIIFIGSEAALKGGKKGSIYCASKFALRGFALSLREECANSGIRICIINPGMVNTPFFDDLNFRPGTEANHTIEANDVSEAIAMVLSSRQGTVFDEINLSPQKHLIEFHGDK